MPKVPDIKSPAPPPTERDGTLEGLGKRRAAVAESEQAGLLTNPTGAKGDTSKAETFKSKLGS